MNETTAFWSGHANSSAMVLRMIEMKNAPDRVVHACTRQEFDFVYEYMEKFQKICEVEIIFEDMAKDNPEYEFNNFFHKPWCRGKYTGEIHGFSFASHGCWHNRNVKQPVYRKYEQISSEVYTGFTVSERHRVIKSNLTHHRYPLMEWGWTAKDSLRYLQKRNLPHIGYEKYGFDRLGCKLCHHQGDLELYTLYKHFPDTFLHLMELEKESPHGFRAKGKSLEELVDIWESEPNYTLEKFEGVSK